MNNCFSYDYCDISVEIRFLAHKALRTLVRSFGGSPTRCSQQVLPESPGLGMVARLRIDQRRFTDRNTIALRHLKQHHSTNEPPRSTGHSNAIREVASCLLDPFEVEGPSTGSPSPPRLQHRLLCSMTACARAVGAVAKNTAPSANPRSGLAQRT